MGRSEEGAVPSTRTHKTHFMKMNSEIDQLPSFTIEEFQQDFDNLIERVQDGEFIGNLPLQIKNTKNN